MKDLILTNLENFKKNLSKKKCSTLKFFSRDYSFHLHDSEMDESLWQVISNSEQENSFDTGRVRENF